jgi:hypothetical protein
VAAASTTSMTAARVTAPTQVRSPPTRRASLTIRAHIASPVIVAAEQVYVAPIVVVTVVSSIFITAVASTTVSLAYVPAAPR